MTNKELANRIEWSIRNSWGHSFGYEWITREEELAGTFLKYHKEILEALRS